MNDLILWWRRLGTSTNMPTNKITTPDTEDTKELADMTVEQLARFSGNIGCI